MPDYTFHPYPVISVSKSVLFLAVSVIAIAFFHDTIGDFLIPLLGAAIIIAALFIVRANMIAQACSITLGEDRIRYRFGIMSKHEYVLPYPRITEARFTQGVLDQTFGIGLLSVDTAGEYDKPMRIAGVRMADIRATLDMVNRMANAREPPPETQKKA